MPGKADRDPQLRQTSAANLLVGAFDQQYLLVVVNFSQFHFNNFAFCRLDRATDKGGFDRELTMAAVAQDE